MHYAINHPELFSLTESRLIKRAISAMEKKLFRSDGTVFHNSTHVMEYLKLKIARPDKEVFTALFLNSQNELLCFEILFEGAVNGVHINTRDIISRCFTHHATGIIFAHNHPSGCTDPSTADFEMTKELSSILNKLDIRLLDHLIIGNGKPFSFAENGLL